MNVFGKSRHRLQVRKVALGGGFLRRPPVLTIVNMPVSPAVDSPVSSVDWGSPMDQSHFSRPKGSQMIRKGQSDVLKSARCVQIAHIGAPARERPILLVRHLAAR